MQKNSGTHMGTAVFYGIRLLLVALVLGGRSQQRTDGQGDLLLLLVDGSDLGVHDVALSQHVAGLLDAAIRDLGDVDQAVHTGNHLGKGAEGSMESKSASVE